MSMFTIVTIFDIGTDGFLQNADEPRSPSSSRANATCSRSAKIRARFSSNSAVTISISSM